MSAGLGFRVLPRIWACALALWAGTVAPSGQTDPLVVHAVLFYSPTCPHCHQVITQDLPPLLEQYAGQLEIIAVDTSSAEGHLLYQAAIDRFDIPPERHGVPTLIVGSIVLVGSVEIPQQFPGWIEHNLDAGGVGWPDIPGLAEVLATAQPAPTARQESPTVPVPSAATPPPKAGEAMTSAPDPSDPAATQSLLQVTTAIDPSSGLSARLARDPFGNAIAIGVLVFMTLTVGRVLADQVGDMARPRPAWHEAAIPALCIVGFTIAGYLAYVEVAQVKAVCGPIGDCNTVQQSEYARLFGLIPIGLVGLAAYAVMAATWLARRACPGRPAFLFGQALFAMSLFGTLFSIYLTFLEPFVIGATCAWCLASAIIMTVLLWLTAGPRSLIWPRT